MECEALVERGSWRLCSCSVRLFGRTLGDIGDFGLGAVKRQKLFPPVPLTTPIERNDAQTRRLPSRCFLIQRGKRGATFRTTEPNKSYLNL